MKLSFYKSIYKEDIIYHYTKTSTAIDHILFNNQLKFGKRINSIDPTESRQANRGIVISGSYMDKEIDKKFSEEANQLENLVFNLENLFYQICFCKNHMGHHFAGENYITQFQGHEEIFGFTKPRMWERYADNYYGVCIAFSKKKILEKNSEKFNLISKDLEYLKYRELACKKIDYISGNHLFQVGYEKYKKEIKEFAESSFFCKHIDYTGENEFRIGVYYEEDKCVAEEVRGEFRFNQTMMLDIEDCIQAIFFSSYTNENQKNTLSVYAEKLNIPLIEMVWKHDSFEPRNYIETMNLFKKVDKPF